MLLLQLRLLLLRLLRLLLLQLLRIMCGSWSLCTAKGLPLLGGWVKRYGPRQFTQRLELPLLYD